MTARALVTGASGMLGRHLVDVLLEADLSVCAFVRDDSDVQHLARPNVQLCYGDAEDVPAMRRAVQGVDFVFHLAAHLTAGAPFGAGDDSPLYHTVNVAFTEHLLAAAHEQGVSRFVFASSSSVYAPNVPVPTPEDAPLRPTGAYGRSKVAAERRVDAYQERGLSTVIVRPAVIYGPGDRYFTPAALQLARLPLLPLVRGGRTLFDVVYARDVAELMWCAAQSDGTGGAVYNAGSGRPTTLRDLVAVYRHLTGRNPRIVPVAPGVARLAAPLARPFLARLVPGAEAALTPEGISLMTRDTHLAMDRAAETLGYRPRFTLQEGLAETLRTVPG